MEDQVYKQTEKEALLDFYRYYLSEFHQVKALYLKEILDNSDDFKDKLRCRTFHYSLENNLDQIVLADLRMNYFHAIETFFEVFFALIPLANKKIPDNVKILERLSNSSFKSNYKKIESIAKGKDKLTFLDDTIKWTNGEFSVTHYLFYYGMTKDLDDFREMAKKSEAGIKKAVIALAKDFSDRKEYNCFKHGLRVFRNMNKIRILNQNDQEKHVDIDFQNSFTYHIYDKKKREVEVITKNYDIKRMVQMTTLCSNLIINMIYLRRVALDPSSIEDNQIPVGVFDNDEIEKCRKYTVPIAQFKQISKREG